MTINRVYAAAGSANEEFKSQYVRSLKWASLGAVTLTALMVWLSPQYIPTPYTLRTEAMQITEVEVIYEKEKPPEVLAPPVLPKELEAVKDDYKGDLEELPDTNIIGFPPITPSYAEPSGEGFVSSSSKPQLIFQAKPHYPEVARLAQVEGTVIVKVLVGVDGQVRAAEIIQGQHPLLNNAALKAARRCVFKAGEQRNMKVQTWVAVPYNFRLH